MYLTKQQKETNRRAIQRYKAILKLANGSEPACAICGCPHAEILHIGHPKHRGGRWHRKAKGSMPVWVLKTPIEEVLAEVQLECPYCNNWHNKYKEYPPEHKQPKWYVNYVEEALNPPYKWMLSPNLSKELKKVEK